MLLSAALPRTTLEATSDEMEGPSADTVRDALERMLPKRRRGSRPRKRRWMRSRSTVFRSSCRPGGCLMRWTWSTFRIMVNMRRRDEAMQA